MAIIENLVKHSLKNGKKAVKNGAKNGVVNGNGVKNGLNGVVNGNGVKNGLNGVDLARKAAVERQTQKVAISQQPLRTSKNRAAVFEIDRVSEQFSEYLNKPRPKLVDKIEDKEAAAKYLAEGQEYWEEHKTFRGYKRYIDPETGQATHKLRDNSKFNKSGKRSAKVRKLSNREIEDANRIRTESEQSFGPTDKTRVHHRFELSFVDRIGAGLPASQRKKLYKLINTSERWPNLTTGNEEFNMIGMKHSKQFSSYLHKRIHKLLAMAGLDPDTVDFTGAPWETRIQFLDEVAPLLDKIDEFIYNEIMAARHPSHFRSFNI